MEEGAIIYNRALTKRDTTLLGLLSLVIAILFAPLILRPWLMPGNFGDLWSYHYPLRHLVAARVQQGEAPLWNPYIFAGVPLAANPQALLLYPLAQLHYFLPLSWAFSLDAFFHVFWAVFGAHLLLRAWRLERSGAAVLAAAYGLSPFLVYRVSQGVPTLLASLAWAPWVWLAALSRHPLPLALTFALQVLSGHPQFALVNAIGLGLWGLLHSPRRGIALVPAAGLGLFLAAAQVLPTLEYLRQSVRSVWNAGLALGYSLEPRFLFTLLWPRAFGDPFEPSFSLMPSEFFEMLGLYLGVVPLALAAFGLAKLRGRGAAAVWALVATGLFFALGQNNPAYLALQSAFKLDFLRVPARFGFLILWGLWLASAYGFRHAAAARGRVSKAVLLAVTLLDLGLLASRWLYTADPSRYLAPQPETARLLAGGARMATSPEVLSANKTMLYRLRNATGYEAFYPAPIALYTARSERGPAADGSRTYIEHWDSPEMAALGVRYYVTPKRQPCERPAERRGDTFIYENPSASPLVTGASAWTEPKAEHLAASAAGLSRLVVRQAFYPGWRAWALGLELPVAVADGLFPEVRAPGPKGRPTEVHVRFVPGSWRMGLLVSLITGFLIVGIAELRLRLWLP